MATVNELLKNLITKSGIAVDDQLTALLSNEALAAIEVPEEVNRGIEQNLISLKDAKNNHPEIKNFYQKQALDTVDTSIVTMLEDFGIDETLRNEILAERSTYKRLPLMVKKVRELEAKKLASTSQTDKIALQKQIDELQAQLRTRSAQEQQLRSEFDSKIKEFKVNYKLDTLLSQYQTVYDNPAAPLDPEVKAMTLRNLLSKQLQENNAALDFDENGNFVLIKKDGTNYYGDNNQQVTPQAFAEQMLSRNKLLVTTPQPAGQAGANVQRPNGQQQPAAGAQPAGGQGGAAKGNSTLSALVKQSMADIENSNKIAVM